MPPSRASAGSPGPDSSPPGFVRSKTVLGAGLRDRIKVSAKMTLMAAPGDAKESSAEAGCGLEPVGTGCRVGPAKALSATEVPAYPAPTKPPEASSMHATAMPKWNGRDFSRGNAIYRSPCFNAIVRPELTPDTQKQTGFSHSHTMSLKRTRPPGVSHRFGHRGPVTGFRQAQPPVRMMRRWAATEMAAVRLSTPSLS
jgi:hypothetical protein